MVENLPEKTEGNRFTEGSFEVEELDEIKKKYYNKRDRLRVNIWTNRQRILPYTKRHKRRNRNSGSSHEPRILGVYQ